MLEGVGCARVPVHALPQVPGPDTARRTLAAALVLEELQVLMHDLEEVALGTEDDHGAAGGEIIEADRTISINNEKAIEIIDQAAAIVILEAWLRMQS